MNRSRGLSSKHSYDWPKLKSPAPFRGREEMKKRDQMKGALPACCCLERRVC